MAEATTQEHERGPPQGAAKGKLSPTKWPRPLSSASSAAFRIRNTKKVVTAYSKFYAHDEKQEAKVGDVVLIRETRPLSKLKRWRLTQIVERSAETPVAAA